MLITVLDKTKVQIAAIKAGKNLRQVNDEAGLSNGYIYQCFGTNRIQLATVDAIASALGCDPEELLSRTEEVVYTQPLALSGVAELMAA